MAETNYRLYIDESGTHDYRTTGSIERRYLGLTGVIIGAQHYSAALQPRLNAVKKMLLVDQDDPLPVLHREELVANRGAFAVLRNPEIKTRFNEAMLKLYAEIDYTIIAVVIDKASHLARYGDAAYDPYHYSLSVMLERYTNFLANRRARGDVMAEARGKREDHLLRGEYVRFYEAGTGFRSSGFIQSVLTSREIKLKPKGISGLEFADLLTLATKLDILSREGVMPEPISSPFMNQQLKIITGKYYSNGIKVQGYGRKLIK